MARWRRRCSTFAVKSKVTRGNRRVDRPGDGQRVPGAVQEVRVADRHVGRAGLDALADVGQDDVRRHDEEAPAVHRRDRAVPAQVLAAAARLDVPDQLVPPVPLEPRVLLEGGQRRRGSGPGSRGAPGAGAAGRAAVRTPGTGSPVPVSSASASATSGASASPPMTESTPWASR